LKPASRPWRIGAGSLLAAGTAGSMLMLSAVAPAGAATHPSGKVVVPQALTVKGLHATRISAAATSAKMTVSFVLKIRNEGALEHNVEADMPSGFLSVRQFADRYGQTRAHIKALVAFLKADGIKSTVYADGLDVSTTGTAGDYEKAVGTAESIYRTPAVAAKGVRQARPAQTFYGTSDPATLPASIGAYVYSILGLTSYATNASEAQHTLFRQPASSSSTVQGNRTPASFAKQYGLTSLYGKGAKGQGETIGIITYASVRPSDATHFWSKVLKIKTKANRIRLINVDGGSGKVADASGSGETTLDVEQSGALAPQANVIVYQAPNSDFGAADAWFGAASSNAAQAVSTSWGESEETNLAIAANGTESATYGGIFNEAALEMAAQGQSAFAAAGDSGAYDDAGDSPTAYTELAVDNPADSPYITAAGGTTEAGKQAFANANGSPFYITIKSQRAWGWDYLWPSYANLAYITGDTTEGALASNPEFAGGGGGGYSISEPRPAYQDRIAGIGDFTDIPYLAPIDYELYPGTSDFTLPTAWSPWSNAAGVQAPPAVTTGSASGRVVPDLAADADPDTGYELYFTAFPAGQAHLQDFWGGTSFVAPQLAGSAAVIDSYLRHRAGFWNPEIYKFATRSWTPFTPLDASGASNDNLYYTGTKGAQYNPATGLGVPNLGKVALDFKYHH